MDTTAPPVEAAGATASAVLDDLVDAYPHDTVVTVGDLIDRLDSRAHGVLLLVLALPMCIPNVPGISTVFGLLMMAPAVQLVLGSRRLWVPQRLRAWSVDFNALRRALQVATPPLKRIEYLIKPRLSALTRFPVTIVIGLQTVLMAIILVLPIPFANWPPGMTVAMTALALLQRDGALMLLTIPAAIASIGSVYLGARVGFAVLGEAMQWLSSLFGG